MAATFKLKGGEKTFNLMFDDTEEAPLKALDTSRADESQPRPIWHHGEGEDGNALVDVTYDDARWPVTCRLGGPLTDDFSDIGTELAALRRTIRQAHAHAAGETWADEVYVEFEPDGTASSTYYTVKLVEDRSGGWLWGAQLSNIKLHGLRLTLTVDGDGYGDEETLDNALRNGHMQIVSATAGLASGLTALGTPTLTLDTTNWLIGGRSQKIVTDDSSTEGVQSATVTIAQSSNIVAYVWSYMAISGNDSVRFVLYDGGANVIESLTVAPTSQASRATNSDMSWIDDNDKTWYRYPLSGSNTSAANCYIRAFRLDTDANQNTGFFIDGLYLETSQTVVPNAWAGYPQVYNRCDRDATNPERVNRFDVWGIPGDRPAWYELAFDASAIANLDKFYLANSVDTYEAYSDLHMIDVSDWTGANQTVYASAHEGNIGREAATGVFNKTVTDEYNGVYHVVAKWRTSDTDNTSQFEYQTGTANIERETISTGTADRWDIHYCGLMDLRTSSRHRTIGTANAYIYGFRFDNTISAGTLDIDYILLLPAEPERLLIADTAQSTLTSGDEMWIVGRDKVVIGDVGAASGTIPNEKHLGSLYTLEPGVMNRLIFLSVHDAQNNDEGDSDLVDVTWDSLITTFTYRPRTRGFLP